MKYFNQSNKLLDGSFILLYQNKHFMYVNRNKNAKPGQQKMRMLSQLNKRTVQQTSLHAIFSARIYKNNFHFTAITYKNTCLFVYPSGHCRAWKESIGPIIQTNVGIEQICINDFHAKAIVSWSQKFVHII